VEEKEIDLEMEREKEMRIEKEGPEELHIHLDGLLFVFQVFQLQV